MITLSYTTINNLILEPHTWLCKQMGLPTFTTGAMTEGKAAHKVIQEHVSGRVIDPRLEMVKCTFKTVETKDQDPATHFLIPHSKNYAVHGYLDGLDIDRFLEIKTSSNPWSMGQFARLMQWRVYALSNPAYKTAWFITCTRDLRNPAVYKIDVTDKDRQMAREWIDKGIAIIEAGNFDYNGTGRSHFCNYIGCPFCGQ